MARTPKVRLRAIPVFPSTVVGGNAIEVTKTNGIWTIAVDVSDVHIAAVQEADTETTYAFAWGGVTDDNPEGSYQLVPFAGFQAASADLTSLADLGTFGMVARIGDADYATRTITGTANRITITNGGGIAGNPTADISTAYVGQATITTLGTIATGVWSATAVAANKGGTGATSYAVGDLLYADTTSTLAKLADIATGNALISGGVGVAPAWGKIGISTHVSGLGTGVATALGVNVGSAGAFVTFNGAGGTPSSITLTGGIGLPLSTGVTGTLQAAQEPAHTGDVTNSAGSLALTLATVNADVGTWGTSASAPSFAVNGKGLITAATQNVITPAVTSITPVAATSLIGNSTGVSNNAQGISLGATLAFSGTALQTAAITGDVTASANSFATTLATVNSNVGTFGSATQSAQVTYNGKGLATAVSNVTITPAVGSITGLGTGIATALAVNVGSAGAPVVNGGALGTPSSGVATNLTGTASGLTAGNVTTNANLTGAVTSVGNATSLGSFSSANLATALTDETGSGANVFATSPTLVTPALGVATATTLNGNTFTTGTYTLTGAAGKTFTFSNTLTLTGTDGSSVAFGAGGTVAYTGSTLAQFAATTSAQLATLLSDETGSGAAVFGTSPTITTPNIVGVTNASDASAGSVGEFVSASLAYGSKLTFVSATAANITSISLTAGDWDVTGFVNFEGSATPSTNYAIASLSTTSAVQNASEGYYAYGPAINTAVNDITSMVPSARFNVSSTTTVYLTGTAGIAGGTIKGWGYMKARRIR